ncbi:MAG: CRISPR system precrRNA processing endoribonuclease RAMP protein Cas6 [Chloroflexi bacterium]|nr:CRISPR system precrRNA processing endoribonuclease RAMP protein Cas6 [Chloroflexota bacterium]
MAAAFSVHQLRFVAEVAAPLRLPPHKGSSLRGGLFEALRAQFCLSPAACGSPQAAAACPVCFLLAPVQEDAPRGRDLPRPYVLRPPADPRTDYQPGERFEFRFLTFGRALGHFPYALLGVQELGRRGLGVGRAGFHLQEVWAEHPLLGRQERLYRAAEPVVAAPALPITADQVEAEVARLGATPRLLLRFHLPLRLIEAGRLVAVSNWRFRPFFQRLAERLLALSEAYAEPLPLRFDRLLQLAERVETVDNRLRWWDLFRHSSRHGRLLPMGGLVGEVVLAGELEPLLPWLVWGQFTHVGKYADHGNGWYELVPAG